MKEKPSKVPLIAFSIAGIALIVLVIYLFTNYNPASHSGRILSDLTRMEEPMEETEHKIDEFLYGPGGPAN